MVVTDDAVRVAAEAGRFAVTHDLRVAIEAAVVYLTENIEEQEAADPQNPRRYRPGKVERDRLKGQIIELEGAVQRHADDAQNLRRELAQATQRADALATEAASARAEAASARAEAAKLRAEK